MIETEKGHLYTGITTDIERRWAEHSAVATDEESLKGSKKKGAKFFRSQKPKKIVYRESCSSRSEASKREAEIKKLTKLQKLQLCESG